MEKITFELDPELIEYIRRTKKDYRVSTTCSGSVILPVELKRPKDTDIKIDIDGNILYVSEFQAKYINRLTIDMVYDAEIQVSGSYCRYSY